MAVAAGADNVGLALLRDGTVVPAYSTDTAAPTNLYGVVAIAAGEHGALALKADGNVVAFGIGAQAVPATVTNLIGISAGFGNLGLRADGTVLSWGSLLGSGGIRSASNLVAVAAGRNYLGLQGNGTVIDLSSNLNGAVPAALTNVVAISTAYGHSLALKQDGTVSSWGNATVPTSITSVSAVSAGRSFSLLLTTNPPSPLLQANAGDGSLNLAAPVAVSGYVLETTDDLLTPFHAIQVLTNAIDLTDTNNPAIVMPAVGKQGFYRLRKLP